MLVALIDFHDNVISARVVSFFFVLDGVTIILLLIAAIIAIFKQRKVLLAPIVGIRVFLVDYGLVSDHFGSLCKLNS